MTLDQEARRRSPIPATSPGRERITNSPPIAAPVRSMISQGGASSVTAPMPSGSASPQTLPATIQAGCWRSAAIRRRPRESRSPSCSARPSSFLRHAAPNLAELDIGVTASVASLRPPEFTGPSPSIGAGRGAQGHPQGWGTAGGNRGQGGIRPGKVVGNRTPDAGVRSRGEWPSPIEVVQQRGIDLSPELPGLAGEAPAPKRRPSPRPARVGGAPTPPHFARRGPNPGAS